MCLATMNVFHRTSLLNRMKQLNEELKAINDTIDKEEVAMAVLNGLPPKYDHLIAALDALVDNAKLTVKLTNSRLMQE